MALYLMEAVINFGDKQTLQFYISTINDEYALNGENLLKESIEFMYELIFNPKLEDGKFIEEYVNSEKEQLRELIKSKINDKGSYSILRCIEEMFPNSAYGIYKYGKEEAIDKITPESLYEAYKKIIDTSEIHLYAVGKFEENKIIGEFKEKFALNRNLPKTHREDVKIFDEKISDVKLIRDTQDLIQGKLVLGYKAFINPSSDDYYKVLVYNAILGSSANSKLFQNVREKESLAYTVRSMYIKHKAIMLITAGIEMSKKEKAIELIKVQVEDMNKGNFSDEDIKNAKVFLINLYKAFTDDEANLVDLSLGQYLLNLDFDVNKIIEKISNVTREDIVYVANKMRLDTEYFLGK